MTENSLEISKVVWEKVTFNRIPTSEELKLIKEREYFDLPNDLINWKESEVTNEDYSFGQITITLNDKKIFEQKGRY